MFWDPELRPAAPALWTARQQDAVRREAWILDGDLGPYDSALGDRLRAADTIVVLDFSFARCAWQALRRGREPAEFWRWVWRYRRQSLPGVLRAIDRHAPPADVYRLRGPGDVERFIARCPEG